MFHDGVMSTALTCPAADWYFSKEKLEPTPFDLTAIDATPLVVKRAFNLSRPNMDKIKIQLTSVTPSGLSDLEYMNRILDEEPDEGAGKFLIIWSTEPIATDEFYNLKPAGFEERGYKEIAKVANFLRDVLKARAFNDGVNTVYVCSPECGSRLSTRQSHYMLGTFAPASPQWIDPTSITTEEKQLLASLFQDDYNAFLKAVEVIAEGYDFETGYMKYSVSDFFSRNRYHGLEQIEEAIKSYQHEISRLESQLTKATNDLGDKRKEYEVALTSGIDYSEVIEYLIDNPSVKVVGLSRNYIKFDVVGYLDNFDPELAESFLRQKNSVVNSRPSDAVISKKEMKMLFKAIFVDEEIKVRVAGSYKLDNQMNISAVDHLDYVEDLYADRCPNPHFYYYRCLGTNAQQINKCLRAHDFVGALEQCVYAARNIQLNDLSATDFIRKQLYTDRFTCLELPNGDVVKPSVAVMWLKEKEEKTEGDTDNE